MRRWFSRTGTYPQLPRVVVAPEDTLAPTLCEKSAQSSVTALSVTPGAGWGKVIPKGKSLGVSFGTPGSRDELSLSGQPTSGKLHALRKLMQEETEPLDYYIIPSEDAHQSEYIASADARREYISNFTGSAGVAVVSLTTAHLFVDSRYWIQAEREIDTNWTLHKVGAPEEKTWLQWIRQDAEPGSLVGADSRLISCQTAVALSSAISDNGSRLAFPRLNLIDASRPDRPARPNNPVFLQPLQFAGQSAAEKIELVREWLRSRRSVTTDLFEVPPGLQGTSTFIPLSTPSPSRVDGESVSDALDTVEGPSGIVISMLDCVAWVLNLRGSDVPFNPVFYSYLVITLDQAILFVDGTKSLDDEVAKHLDELGVTTRDYGDIWTYLRKEKSIGQMMIDIQTPYAVAVMLTPARYTILNYSYITQLKGIKNEVEIKGFRDAYLRDAAAFVRWSAWLEETVKKKKQPVTEWGAAQKLTEYRQQLDHFMGLAYENISATGANAALPHYEPTRGSAVLIDSEKPYLNDSGGQYLDGTCDTTRTVHFGAPTQEQKDAYTRVLQGHIAIDTAVFPSGTTGAQLDVLARKALWKNRLNYGHGTGHGFGSFLSVHEGPHSFGNAVALRPGAVITNEPGFYKPGDFGIRIESALLVKEVTVKDNDGQEVVWLAFDRFTQVPIQGSPFINFSLLTKDERRWLRNHNRTCRENLTPMLRGDKRAMKWLKKTTGKVGPIEILWE